MSGGTVWAVDLWATDFWAVDFWTSGAAAPEAVDAHDGQPERIRRSKRKPYRKPQDNLRQVIKRAAELQVIVDRADDNIFEAQGVSESVPVRLLSGQHARAQVAMLKIVLTELRGDVEDLEIGPTIKPRLQEIDGQLDQISEVAGVIIDVSTATQVAVGKVLDYAGGTKTVTLSFDPGVFTMAATDKIVILSSEF